MTYPATTAVITLSRPLTVAGNELTELNMREPTVYDKILMEKEKGVATERESIMIARLCDLEAKDLHPLPAYDYEQLVEAFNRFLLPPEKRLKGDF